MKIRVLRKKSDLYLIQDEWNKLYCLSESTVFQSFQYFISSIKDESEIFVIIVEKESELLQIWPCILRENILEFINHKHADYCDILSINSSKIATEFILENSQIKRIDFKNIRKESILFNLFDGIENKFISKDVNASKLLLSRTDSFPSNFTHFIYRQRRRLKRILNKYNGTLEFISSVDRDFPLDQITRLKDKMIHSGIRSSDFLEDSLLQLSQSLYEEGILEISVLSIRSKICGISFYFNQENEYFLWIDLYDNQKMMNLYHNTLFIKHMSEKEDVVINFGRGDYSYKIQNFSPVVFPIYNLYIFKNKFNNILFQLQYKLTTFVKSVYSRLKR